MHNDQLDKTRLPRNKKNHYRFRFTGTLDRKQIIISSSFDSGNIELIKQISEFAYRLAAVPDLYNQPRSKKTWFYFKVQAFAGCRVRLIIENVEVLLPAYEWELQHRKPVFKIGEEGAWKRLGKQCFVTRRQELEIVIDYQFTSNEPVFFALSVPFSYLENYCFFEELELEYQQSKQIYYRRELLTYSYDKRMVHLITITQYDQEFVSQVNPEYEKKFHPQLFPEENSVRPFRFADKPIVLITCRVHPGEVSSSHTLIGFVKFIMSQNDLRAYLLRKLFVFMIIPMMNPDGVFDGNYRMDSLGRNLNRLYQEPVFSTEPQVFAAKALIEHLQPRMFMYLDMHSHTSAKHAFIYGNAFDDILQQTETQIFAKILSVNSKSFSYEHSNFSEEQMTSKDTGEPISKQGCSRVNFSKITGLPYCYTLQIGLYFLQTENECVEPSNKDLRYRQLGLTEEDKKYINDDFLGRCYEIGRATGISILDLINKNPYTRLQNISSTLDSLRRSLATTILQEQDRFRKFDCKVFQKLKNIQKLIQEAYYDRLIPKWAHLQSDTSLFSTDRLGNFFSDIKSFKALDHFASQDALKIKQVSRREKQKQKTERDEPSSNAIFASRSKKLSSECSSFSPRKHREESPLKRNNITLAPKNIELPKIMHKLKTESTASNKALITRKQPKEMPGYGQITPSQLLQMQINNTQVMRIDNKRSKVDSRRKNTVLENLKMAELEADRIFENCGQQPNFLSTLSYEDPIAETKYQLVRKERIKTEEIEDILHYQIRSNKALLHDQLHAESNLVDDIIVSENSRYARLVKMIDDSPNKVRITKACRRELVNSKLGYLKKKMLETRVGSKLPTLARINTEDLEYELFNDKGVRELCVSSKRMLNGQHQP